MARVYQFARERGLTVYEVREMAKNAGVLIGHPSSNLTPEDERTITAHLEDEARRNSLTIEPEEWRWDAFISHSSRDTPFVRELAGALRSWGFRIFLDEDQIDIGTTTQVYLDLWTF